MIRQNQVLARQSADGKSLIHYRVLRVHDGKVALFNLSAKNAMPEWLPEKAVEEGLDDGSFLLADDGFAPPLNVVLSEPTRRARDRRKKMIAALVEDHYQPVLFPDTRWPLIKAQAQDAGTTPARVLALLRCWWRGGCVENALVPLYRLRGGPGGTRTPSTMKRGRPRIQLIGRPGTEGINVDTPVLKAFQHGFNLVKRGYPVRQAYCLVIKQSFSERKEVDGDLRLVPRADKPSERQFRYWLSKFVSKADILRHTKGDEAFERNHAPRPGNARAIAFGPGSYYQIDATVADVEIVSELFSDQIIGRPIVYIVVDVFTGMIVGFAVTLSVSWEGAAAALENAFSDKVEYCSTLDIEISPNAWPAAHIPANLDADRGPEFMSEYFGTVANTFGFVLNNDAPYRPDLKGFVEYGFSVLKRGWEYLPGSVPARKRGDRKRKGLPPVLTRTGFVKWLVAAVKNYNNSPVSRQYRNGYPYKGGCMPSPAELWNWGCQTLGVPRSASAEVVRLNLMCQGEALETDKGLKFNGLHYAPPGGLLGDTSVRYHRRKWPRFKVLYDARDISSIRVFERGATTPSVFVLAPCDSRFHGWCLDEVKASRTARTVGNRTDEDRRQMNYFEYVDTTETVVASEKAKKRASASSVAQTPASKRKARSAEKRNLDRQHARTAVSRASSLSATKPSPAPANANHSEGTQPAQGTAFSSLFTQIMKGSR